MTILIDLASWMNVLGTLLLANKERCPKIDKSLVVSGTRVATTPTIFDSNYLPLPETELV